MKKLSVATVFIIVLSGLSAQAQIINLGVHGGLNYPDMKLNNSTLSSYKNYGGLVIGGWARIGGMFYVQPEVNYTWTKAGITGSGGAQSPVNLHHMQLALSPAVRPLRKKAINFRLGGTASYSFLMVVNSNSIGINRDDFRTGAFHAGPFVGFDFWRFTLDGRYLFGIGNQSANSGEKWRNNLVQATLGFRILGQK
ncbi:MAG: PorT family protein [Flavobacteriales bacterium]|nr:PorT family protein [Flavobacteriales bacterium]